MTSTAPVGRPRNFDESQTLDTAVEAFWRFGISGSTTRTLESELGLTQSSIYNAFGSKAELASKAIDRYIEMLDEGLVCQLDCADAGYGEFKTFLSELVEWISDEERPGCLLLNLSAERGIADDDLVERSTKYRLRLRELLAQLLSNEGAPNHVANADLIVAAILGMNIAARTGAKRAEIERLATGLRSHVELLASTAG